MKGKAISFWTVSMMAALFLAGAGALAQDRPPVHFSGLLNDYTPSTVKGGPYEMRGIWSLRLHGDSATADFSAEMNMETSDYGTQIGVVDPANPATRGAHTHHIVVTDATVTWNMDGCPSFSPATEHGFQITGTVSVITGNGSIAPFETKPLPTSRLTVCITGGDSVSWSNMTMQFVDVAPGTHSPAASHFGLQAIHGLVTQVSGWRRDRE